MAVSIHEGHRGRMRARFREEGLDGFAHHEALELLLFYGRARGDVNPLAHTLLDTFGSIKGVLEATPDQLMTVPGVGEETATLISLMIPMFRRYQAAVREEVKRVVSWEDIKRYCVSLLSGWRLERCYLLSLNASCRVVGQRLVATGSLSEIATYPRLIVETALNHNAHGVILCHNHPGGTLMPSEDDKKTTQSIQSLLRELNIDLVDHVIVAGEEAYSMGEHGDLARLRVNTKA